MTPTLTTALRRATAATLIAVLGSACTPLPPASPEPLTASLAGEVRGAAAHGADTCPVGQSFRRVLTMQVDAPLPSDLSVDVCSVDTTARGGALARGGFRLETADGTLWGTAQGSWTWSFRDVLRVELVITGATGSLRAATGSFELVAEVERFDPIDDVTGTLAVVG